MPGTYRTSNARRDCVPIASAAGNGTLPALTGRRNETCSLGQPPAVWRAIAPATPRRGPLVVKVVGKHSRDLAEAFNLRRWEIQRSGNGTRGFGTATRAFDEWRMVDSEMRAFLALTTRWMQERYEQIWSELGAQPGTEDGPELPDLFYRAVHGLEPLDYHWMLQAAVVRDAVSAFEVYLDKVGAEVLQRHGHTWKVRLGRTPDWSDITFFLLRPARRRGGHRVRAAHPRPVAHAHPPTWGTSFPAATRAVRPEQRRRIRQLPR